MNTLTQTPPEAISSIGAVWPPTAASDARLRGFYPELVTPQSLEEFYDTFRDQNLFLHKAVPAASRLTIRAVVKSDLVGRIGHTIPGIEAAIPLGGDFSGNHIVYMGTTQTYRSEHDENIINTSIDNLTEAQKRPHRPLPTEGELSAEGLRLVIADRRMDDGTIQQFTDLYQPFGYSQKNVANLAENPNNTILYLQDKDGVITSSAMAEHASVEISGLGTLNMAEVTEATTNPGYRGKGHYRVVSGFLLEHILEQADKDQVPLHAVYGESSLDPNSVGVLKAAADNGRRFSFSEAGWLGISNDQRDTPFGVLPQHVRIGDKLQNFAVSYLPLQ